MAFAKSLFPRLRYRSLEGGICAAALLGSLAASCCASAQTLPAQASPAVEASPPVVCLERGIKGARASAVAGAQSDVDVVAIAIPEDAARQYAKRGFVPVKCSDAVVLSRAQRQQVCAFSSVKDPAMNAYFWQRFGFTPDESCEVLKDAGDSK